MAVTNELDLHYCLYGLYNMHLAVVPHLQHTIQIIDENNDRNKKR